MWRIQYIMHVLKDKKGIGVVEVILILVVKSTPYHGVGIRCIA